VGFVLAIEPDVRQAALVRRLMKEAVRADLALVDSKDAAIAAIERRMPDLILVTALMSPRDESELLSHLRACEAPPHLQTLTIPLLAPPPPVETADANAGLLTSLKRRRKKAPPTSTGCDPAVFAQEIVGYLQRAEESRPPAPEPVFEEIAAIPAVEIPPQPEPESEAVLPVVEAAAPIPEEPFVEPVAAPEPVLEEILAIPVVETPPEPETEAVVPVVEAAAPIPEEPVAEQVVEPAELVEPEAASPTMALTATEAVVLDGEVIEEIVEPPVAAAPPEPVARDVWPRVELVEEPIVEVAPPALDLQADNWLASALADLTRNLHRAIDPAPPPPVATAATVPASTTPKPKVGRRTKVRKGQPQQTPRVAKPRALPMSMWVRANPVMIEMPDRTNETHAMDALLRALKVPQSIAAVEYARGCRIGRVRVARQKRRTRQKDKTAPVIVISARLLASSRETAPATSSRD